MTDGVDTLPRIPLAEPMIGGNAAAYLQACLDTNFVSSVGPFVDRFEQAFADTIGTRFAVACASGTAAIHLALRVLDVSTDDDVFVPTLTFVASANPVRYVDARVTLVDVETDTFDMDPQIVIDELDRRGRAGRRQPAAVEVVHLVGHPASIEPIVEACARHGVPIIEDASEALGATYATGRLAGRHVGTVGKIGCFSFNGNKIITSGGGGMLVTDDESLARRARHLSTQARLPGRAYDHDEIGFNYRLSNISAALGLAQLEQLPALLAGRRANADRYDAAIGGSDRSRPALRGLLPAPRADWARPSFWLYTARLDRTMTDIGRGALIDALATRQIEARPIWTPLHRTRIYAGAERLGGDIADRIFAEAISLPSSSNLGPDGSARVIGALADILT